MSADAVPGSGDLPGFGDQPGAAAQATSDPSPGDPIFSPRDIYLLLLSVVIVAATYVIGGYPLGYLRFPLAVYWIVMGARYLRATGG